MLLHICQGEPIPIHEGIATVVRLANGRWDFPGLVRNGALVMPGHNGLGTGAAVTFFKSRMWFVSNP